MASRKKAPEVTVPVELKFDIPLDMGAIQDVVDEILHEQVWDEVHKCAKNIVDKKRVNAIVKEVAASLDVEAEVRKIAKERMIRAAMGG